MKPISLFLGVLLLSTAVGQCADLGLFPRSSGYTAWATVHILDADLVGIHSGAVDDTLGGIPTDIRIKGLTIRVNKIGKTEAPAGLTVPQEYLDLLMPPEGFKSSISVHRSDPLYDVLVSYKKKLRSSVHGPCKFQGVVHFNPPERQVQSYFQGRYVTLTGARGEHYGMGVEAGSNASEDLTTEQSQQMRSFSFLYDE